MTNVLLEGGARVLGSFVDGRLIDEAHVFIAPTIFGGRQAPSPVAGLGVRLVREAQSLKKVTQQIVGCDVYINGRVGSSSVSETQ